MRIVFGLLCLCFLIFFHELGHFIFARINGIEVLDFSIGMGPRLCGFKAFGTQFSLRLLPIGGVKFVEFNGFVVPWADVF